MLPYVAWASPTLGPVLSGPVSHAPASHSVQDPPWVVLPAILESSRVDVCGKASLCSLQVKEDKSLRAARMPAPGEV